MDRCLDNQFTCNNKRCIPTSLTCNGVDNCGDSTDETFPCTGKNNVNYIRGNIVIFSLLNFNLRLRVNHDFKWIFYLYGITESWQCCNELELVWEYEVGIRGAVMLMGNFTKLSIVSNDRPVYYGGEGGYYLYNRKEDWLVSYRSIYVSKKIQIRLR